MTPNAHSELWARLGLPYRLNEYRACWKCAGLPLAQRLRDKGHNWEDLRQLIPDALALGLMGYAYVCPDMIGGGEYSYFYDNPNKPLDQELIVRSAQCSALMPMMQFSVAPWRVLSEENMAICRRMAELHVKLGPEILALARASARDRGAHHPARWSTCTPIGATPGSRISSCSATAFSWPRCWRKGLAGRKVVIPPGTWRGDDGSEVVGPRDIEIDVPLARLPWYRLAAAERP